MGNANISRGSKGKGVLGGIIKRVTGRADTEGPAPRGGLRDRFSAFEPMAAPTDPVPKKVSDTASGPDENSEKKVIRTSTVRSGGVSFSDRLGFAAGSDSDDCFERRISFDETDKEEEDEEESITVSCTEAEYAGRIDGPIFFEDNDKEDAEEENIHIGDTATDPECEVPAAGEDMCVEAADPTEAPAAEESVIPSDEDYDGGYDFLPRRNVSERLTANADALHINESTADMPVSVSRAPIVSAAPERKEDTALGNRLRERLLGQTRPKRSAEVQVDAPTQHEDAMRTSLMDRILNSRAPTKSVSEILRETNITKDDHAPADTAADAGIEELDADTDVMEYEIVSEICFTDDEPRNDVLATEEAVLQEEMCDNETTAGTDVAEAITTDTVEEFDAVIAADDAVMEMIAADTDDEGFGLSGCAAVACAEERYDGGSISAYAGSVIPPTDAEDAFIEDMGTAGDDAGTCESATVTADAECVPAEAVHLMPVNETVTFDAVMMPFTDDSDATDEPYDDILHALMEIGDDTLHTDTEEYHAFADEAEEHILALMEGVILDGTLAATEDVFFEHFAETVPDTGCEVSSDAAEDAVSEISDTTEVPADETGAGAVCVIETIPESADAIPDMTASSADIGFVFVTEDMNETDADVTFVWGR